MIREAEEIRNEKIRISSHLIICALVLLFLPLFVGVADVLVAVVGVAADVVVRI